MRFEIVSKRDYLVSVFQIDGKEMYCEVVDSIIASLVIYNLSRKQQVSL
jgi:hypothetical protein